MVNEPKVSIIVPVHNADTTIHTCVESIVNQSYANIECILIENGSTDNSPQICQKYAELYACIKYINNSQVGVSAARNLGLSVSDGDIIGFCDADDFFEPGAFLTVVNQFLDTPNIIGVISAFYVGKKSETGIQKNCKHINKKIISTEDAVKLTLLDDNVMGSVWNRFYQADIARSTLFDTTLSYCEDTHYNVKLLSSVENGIIAYIQQPIYCYMMNSDSATHQLDKLYNENGELKYIIALKRIIYDCHLSDMCLSAAKARIAAIAIDYLYHGYTNNLQKSNLKKEIKQNMVCFVKNTVSCDRRRNLKRLVKLFLSLVK